MILGTSGSVSGKRLLKNQNMNGLQQSDELIISGKYDTEPLAWLILTITVSVIC